ncbi:MAG: hypothetical protein NVSMB30_26210 [Hymenobacter sp.]
MDNQQDQFGNLTPTNAGRTTQNPATTPGTAGTSRAAASTPDSTASGASAATRKSAAMPNAQGSAAAPGAQNQHTATVGVTRQGEGQQTNDPEGNLLDTALQSGKKWIEDSGVLDSVNQLPQTIKDFGNRAVSRVGDLSTTQKVVGGALLAVGLGWLATRKGKVSSTSSSDFSRQSSGNYGRGSYGYQAPDASTSRRTVSGVAGRTDRGAPYGNSGSRYSSGAYNTGTSSTSQGSRNTPDIHSGSGRMDSGSGFGSSSTGTGDFGSRTSDSSYRSNSDDARSGE